MSPSPVQKEVLGEQRTRSKTRASNVLIENTMNLTDDNLISKLRTRRRENTNDNLLASAKQTKRSMRKRRETTSSAKQAAQKDTSPKTEKMKSRMFKQTLSNEDIANILNNDAPIMSSASSEQSNISVCISKTMNNSISVKEVVSNTFSETDMVTPKSSPIVVNLTPHRSRKTPKKSPIVSSPKTHTGAPLRLSKTPRKLAITADSPDMFNQTSPDVSTPHRPEKDVPVPVQSIHNSLKRKHTPDKKPKNNRSFNTKFTPTIRRFSKSPKIVIRTPKSKSKSKYKSPKSKLSTRKRSHVKVPIIRVSPPKEASLLSPQSSLTSTTVKSLKAEKLKDYSKKAVETAAKTLGIKIPNEMYSLYAAAILNQPKVVLESVPGSIPNEDTTPAKGAMKPKRLLLSSSGEKIGRTLNLMLSPLPVNKTSPRATSSPFHSNSAHSNTSLSGKLRVSDTFNKSVQILDESQPSLLCDSLLMNSKDNASESFFKKSTDGADHESHVVETEHENPANGTYDLLEPKTPNLRDKCRKRSSIQAELSSPSNTAKKACKVRFANPLFNRSSSGTPSSPLQIKRLRSTNMSHTKLTRLQTPISIHNSKASDIMKRRQGAGSPSLSSSAHKRASVIKNLVARKSLLLSNKTKPKSLSTANFEPRDKSEKASLATLKPKVGNIELNMQGTTKNTHRGSPFVLMGRSVPMTNGITNGSAKTDIKKRSIALSSVSPSPMKFTRSHQGSSVKKLDQSQLSSSTMKKTDVKTPIARKMPNFAQIHQKKFEEMESLVDAKDRIAKRHIALSTMAKSQVKPKPANPDGLNSQSTNVGIYNRFGFRLKKNDAMHLITRTQHVRQNVQEKNRALLKGVRVNRRFELQMKLRKLNA